MSDPTVLDWRNGQHVNPAGTAPCVHCGKPTPLLDDARRPSHKVCAELAQQKSETSPEVSDADR